MARSKPTKAAGIPSQYMPDTAARSAALEVMAAGIPDNLIPAARIRKLCGDVSPVTFWRWRRSAKMSCPELTEINGRLYGGEGEWLAWRDSRKRSRSIANV
jgi:hypothetical protein